jgi:hypothetical protein
MLLVEHSRLLACSRRSDDWAPKEDCVRPPARKRGSGSQGVARAERDSGALTLWRWGRLYARPREMRGH